MTAALISAAAGCGSATRYNNRDPNLTSLTVNGLTPTDPDAKTNPPDSLPRVEVATNAAAIFRATASDPDNDLLTYTWENANVDTGANTGTSSLAKLTPTSAGTTIVTCKVVDNRGGSATRSIAVVAVDPSANRPPVVSLTATPQTVAAGGTSVIVAAATDPDNDALTYRFFASSGSLVVPDTTQPQAATYTAPAAPGTYSVACIVTDAKGASTGATIDVTVK